MDRRPDEPEHAPGCASFLAWDEPNACDCAITGLMTKRKQVASPSRDSGALHAMSEAELTGLRERYAADPDTSRWIVVELVDELRYTRRELARATLAPTSR